MVATSVALFQKTVGAVFFSLVVLFCQRGALADPVVTLYTQAQLVSEVSFGNCPADHVSWYDAVAFCRWLSVRLEYQIRLPTEWEWEWQQAATGGDPRNVYPWGWGWGNGLANTFESKRVWVFRG